MALTMLMITTNAILHVASNPHWLLSILFFMALASAPIWTAWAFDIDQVPFYCLLCHSLFSVRMMYPQMLHQRDHLRRISTAALVIATLIMAHGLLPMANAMNAVDVVAGRALTYDK